LAGSIIVDSLLSKNMKVRVVGRDLGRLHHFVRRVCLGGSYPV
jgi:hypothetical protein